MILLISLTLLFIHLFSNPFLRAQKSGWYPFLLQPVVDLVTSNTNYHQILDIGTGPGTLLEMISRKAPGLILKGVDSSPTMIDSANDFHQGRNISFQLVPANQHLPFSNDEFDAICFCSVLFLLEDPVKRKMMQEALRLLKRDGIIIVLSPSGNRPIITSLIEIWKYPFSIYNWTYVVWKVFTNKTARNWHHKKWLTNFATEQNLHYQSTIVFDNNATIEILHHSTHLN